MLSQKTRFLALAAALTLAAAPIHAQGNAGSLAGRVQTPEGAPVPDAQVVLRGPSRVATTGAEGTFDFATLPAGPGQLEAIGAECRGTATYTIVAGQKTEVEIVCEPLTLTETITVSAVSRRPERIVEAPAAVTVVSAEEIAQEASSGQVPKLLEFTPGVEVTQSGLYDFNLNTRGFNSSLNRRVVTLIDGRDPSVPFLGAQEWAAISFPMDDLQSVELVRGPSSALYGANAFNGVLNMVTKNPRDSGGGLVRLTAGELETLNLDFRHAGEISDSWAYKFVAGWRESGDFTKSRNAAIEYAGLPREAIPLVVENDDEIGLSGLRFDKYFANGHVATVEGGYAQLQGPAFQTGIGRVQLVDVERPWARVNYNAPRWNFLANWDGRDGEQRSLASGAPLFLDSTTYAAELQGNLDVAGGRGRIVGGLSYNDESIDTADAAGRQTLTFAKIDSDSQAAFAQFEWDFTDSLRMVVAGRYDDSSLHDAQFTPKGALVWSVNPNHTLRFSYNEAFQVANYSEFFLQARTTFPGTTTSAISLAALEQALRPVLGGVSLGFSVIPVLALGNENLDLEEIKTFEIGYLGALGSNAFMTIDYYNSESENFISDLLPNLGATGRLNGQFGAYTPPAALSAQARAIVLQQLAALAASNPALRGVLPFLSNNKDGAPIIALATYTNFGQVDSQGVEFGFDYRKNGWNFHAQYAWFDFDIVDTGGLSAAQLEPNTPENTYGLSIGYDADRWRAGVSFRAVEEFRWIVGPFNGLVPSYEVLDVDASVRVTDTFQLGLNVSNAADDEHFQSFGGDVLGRRALASMTWAW
ncbi:MAG: TonB-dependent receptor [Thermoanaerobaculia bacterium]|nr:TonB-dependent receptor [Thermoanaerobaculia bacterium]